MNKREGGKIILRLACICRRLCRLMKHLHIEKEKGYKTGILQLNILKLVETQLLVPTHTGKGEKCSDL